MNCQNLFSGKNKKKKLKCRIGNNLHEMSKPVLLEKNKKDIY